MVPDSTCWPASSEGVPQPDGNRHRPSQLHEVCLLCAACDVTLLLEHVLVTLMRYSGLYKMMSSSQGGRTAATARPRPDGQQPAPASCTEIERVPDSKTLRSWSRAGHRLQVGRRNEQPEGGCTTLCSRGRAGR